MIPKIKACALVALALSLVFCGLSWADETDLVWSTFLGGSDYDSGHDIALDGSGNAYVTGCTFSSGFPTTAGAFDTTHNGDWDVFVAKLNPTGSDLDYATFLGGSDVDRAWGIALDGSGNAYVTGHTVSSGFPTTAGAFDTIHNGDRDVFVAKLDLSGYPTPVVLASFQATGGQSYIALNWVTASEINCHRWEVHRSKRENGQYAKVGELPGHGSTETVHNYRWVDRQVVPGVTYFYKLKQVDFDGSSWWSHTVSASSTAPSTYALHQNYPNPFNPVTEITYTIPEDMHVTLKVYNVLGAGVTTLVDAPQKASFYTVRWDAEDLASGVYFCRLQAGEFEKTVKMILLK